MNRRVAPIRARPFYARSPSRTHTGDQLQTTARMADVAAAAGVSMAIVSNVLNQPDIVAPGTREKVREAIRALQYRRAAHVARRSEKSPRTRRPKPNPAPATGWEKHGFPKVKSAAHINPYFTADQAAQVRAALQAAGPGEGYVSLSDLVVAATMEEVKRLQRRYNEGRHWPGISAGRIRRGRPTLGEATTRNPSSEGICRARGGTRTTLGALQALGTPENTRDVHTPEFALAVGCVRVKKLCDLPLASAARLSH
ncbi:ParB family protein [Pseudarthrobacter sp. alpha12b]